MMASVHPFARPSRKRARMSRDSGVVCSLGRTSPATCVSTVPIRMFLRPTLCRSCSSRNVVVVLPLVPVTAESASRCFGVPVKRRGEFGQGAATVRHEGEREFGLLLFEPGEHLGGVGEDGG